MKRLSLIVLLVSIIANIASASVLWNNGAAYTGNWSEIKWYDSGTLTLIAHPGGEADTRIATNGVVTVNVSNAQCGLLFLGRGGTPATLNINSDSAYLLVKKDSGELVSMSYDDASSGTINHSAGTLKITRTGGAGTGELRMSHSAYGPQDVANYNLSGTVLLDVEILSRGDKTSTNAKFNATGGTLAVQTSIIKWGLVSENANYGFKQGGCLLAPDGIGVIGSMLMGNSSNLMDYFMESTSKVKIDLGNGNPDPSLSSNDLITSWGNFTVDGELQVNLMGTYSVGNKWNVWKIESTKIGTYFGSGAFDILPPNIQVNWLTGSGAHTLQLEYIPEPTTLVLLGLGGLF